jgi:hypothetical protein
LAIIINERKKVLCFDKQIQILLFSVSISKVSIDSNVDLWCQFVSRWSFFCLMMEDAYDVT